MCTYECLFFFFFLFISLSILLCSPKMTVCCCSGCNISTCMCVVVVLVITRMAHYWLVKLSIESTAHIRALIVYFDSFHLRRPNLFPVFILNGLASYLIIILCALFVNKIIVWCLFFNTVTYGVAGSTPLDQKNQGNSGIFWNICFPVISCDSWKKLLNK